MTVKASQPGAISPLEREVRSAAGAVRSALVSMLAFLPGVHRPADLQRLLGIDYTMSWKAMRIAEARDPLTIACDVPRPGSIKRLVKAAQKQGIDPGTLGSVEASVRDFESLAKRLAGDRGTFDAMLADFSPDAAQRLDLEARRMAFRANSHLLGCQVDALLSSVVVRPSGDTEGNIDAVWLIGTYGLKRFRQSASLYVHSKHLESESVAEADWPRLMSLEQASGGRPHGQRTDLLLRDFSSDPLPPVRVVEDSAAHGSKLVFDHPEVGLKSSIDCVSASVYLDAPPDVEESGDRVVVTAMRTSHPVRLLSVDLFVHEDVARQPAVTEYFFINQDGGAPWDPHPDPSLLLRPPERAQNIGRGFAAARCREIPRYDELLASVFDRMGWGDDQRHQLIRCIVPHPMLYARTALRLPV